MLGHAVDRQPAEEIDREVAIVVERQEGAEGEPLIGEQQDGRHAGEQAEAERKEVDPRRVVAEQVVGGDAPKAETADPGHGAKISPLSSEARVLATPRPPESQVGTKVVNQPSSPTVSQNPAMVPTASARKAISTCQRAEITAAGNARR